MFRVVIDEPTGCRVLGFTFRHVHGGLGSRATICTIFNEKMEPLVEGVSHCCSMDADHFNKEFGRKKSLTRALENLGLNKEGRLKVWHTYFNRPRINTSKKVVNEAHETEGVPV